MSLMTQQPPVDMVVPAGAQLTAVVLIGLLTAAAVGYGLWRLVGRGEALLLLMVVGAGLGAFVEPVWDVLSNIWFASDGQWTGMSSFGRDVPVWIIGAYAVYWGAVAYLVRHVVPSARLAGRNLAVTVGGLMLVNAALEIPLVLMGLYHYYGQHGLKIGGLPLYWIVINATAALLIAVTSTWAYDRLRGWRRGAVVLVPPLVQPATSVALGWPMFVTVNADPTAATAWAVSLVVIAVTALALYLVAPLHVSARPEPTRSSGSPAHAETGRPGSPGGGAR